MNLTLIACLTPLLLIVILMKFILLMEESGREIVHVKEEAKKPHTYMQGVYDDVDNEEEEDWE